MKKIVLSTILMLGLQCMAQNTVPEGAINGLFTINSNGDQVYFSKGNLQYIGSEDQPYWKFADSQWEYLGENGQGSNSHNVNRDLFGWGTSGYKHGAGCFKPWSTSTNWSDYYAYGHPDYHLYSKTGQADWGYNAISNGGNMEKSGWRTLSEEEWNYIFNTRNTPSGIRFTKGKVNNIDGVILLPDDWDASYQFLQRINFAGDIGFKVNTFTASEWSVMESHGAVFLPAAGYREGWYSIKSSGLQGCYWSSSCSSQGYAHVVSFSHYGIRSKKSENSRHTGYSVRLVKDTE